MRASSVSVSTRMGWVDEVGAVHAEQVRTRARARRRVPIVSSASCERRVQRAHQALSDEARELVGLVLGGERVGEVVQVAVHDLLDLVQREVDAVVGHAALREVVGADAVGAVAGADEALPLGGLLRRLLALLLVLDARGEDAPGLLAVLVLAARVLALDHDAGGQRA